MFTVDAGSGLCRGDSGGFNHCGGLDPFPWAAWWSGVVGGFMCVVLLLVCICATCVHDVVFKQRYSNLTIS